MGIRIDLQLFAGDEKTEPATPRRREEARKKGQVAKSGEVSIAVLVLVSFTSLHILGPTIWRRIQSMMQHFLLAAGEWDGTAAGLRDLVLSALLHTAVVVGPILAILFVFSFVSQAGQVGMKATPESLKPKFSRINPIEGFKRIFSKRAIIEFLKSVFKISVIGYFVYRQLRASLQWVPGLSLGDLTQSLSLIEQSVFQMAVWSGVFLMVMAVADYLYQRWEFEQSIRMTKQEIKEELKQTEGDPQIRSKIRQRQRQMAANRMMQAIPTADVVITNPTHYAVAIQYDAGKMNAPQVVAKGMGFIAQRIKEIAAENDVTTLAKPELARALYHTTEIGQEIPADLYPAVAEVLAFIYRLRNRSPHS